MGAVLVATGRRWWSFWALAAAIAFVPLMRAEEIALPRAESFPSQLSYVYPVWQEAEDYKRISEYFTEREREGGDTVLRTDRMVRQGMYFRIGLPWGKKAPPHSRVRIEYLRSDQPRVLTEEFALSASDAGVFSEIRLGLTGSAWAEKRLRLVAWRVTLSDEAGRPLARAQSYLWGLPELAEASAEGRLSEPKPVEK